MTVPECIERQLAYWEALRRLGFPADEIYVAFHGDRLFTELHTAGGVFRIEVAYGVKDRKGYEAAWRAACDAWNGGMPESERRRIYEGLGHGWAAGLVTALLRKGIRAPRTADA